MNRWVVIWTTGSTTLISVLEGLVLLFFWGGGPVPSVQSGVETNEFLNAALRHSHECFHTQADLLAESNRTMYCHHRWCWFLIWVSQIRICTIKRFFKSTVMRVYWTLRIDTNCFGGQIALRGEAPPEYVNTGTVWYQYWINSLHSEYLTRGTTVYSIFIRLLNWLKIGLLLPVQYQ